MKPMTYGVYQPNKRQMTPAINLLKKNKTPHSILKYQHDPAAPSYGLEATEKLGLNPATVFKTLVVELDKQQWAVCILPVAEKLSMKAAAKAAGAKKAGMAKPQDVERMTGYILGGVSPLGQKKRLPTFIHYSATALETMHVSAGRRGLEVALTPADLSRATGGHFAPLTVTEGGES